MGLLWDYYADLIVTIIPLNPIIGPLLVGIDGITWWLNGILMGFNGI